MKIRPINPNNPKIQLKVFFIDTRKTIEKRITVAPSFQNLMKVVE